MELPGETYLYNLSLVALTFTAVSAVVMLIRQTLGGRLSNFDVYLIAAYTSFGFVQGLSAILPSLVAMFNPIPWTLWFIASGLAAIAIGSVLFATVKRRHIASPEPMSLAVALGFSVHGAAVFVLLINALIAPWQGAHLHAAAVTLSLSATMCMFVRRISSLQGDKPGEDWDPKRG